MRILFVLENYYPNIGGVETLFKSLAEQLAEQGHEVGIVTTQLSKHDPREEVIGNITIRRYPFWNRYFFTFFAVFPIMRWIGKYDLIHTTSYNAALPAYLAAVLFRKKIIITFHEVWGDLWFRLPFMSAFGQRLHYYFEQMLLRFRFDRFVAVSESTASNLAKGGVAKDRIVVNYNGIDYSEFDASQRAVFYKKEKAFIYTYFGRLGMSKGLDLLLDAAAIFKTKVPNSKLKLIIPTTPASFFEVIMATIREKDLEDYVILEHHLPFQALQVSLQASDCVVIPSYSEGFCYAAVEAIALGVGVISSDQAALREVVSGTFIKMKSHDAMSLVAALESAYRGDWEKTPVKRFELAATRDRYISLYKKLVQKQ